MVDTLPVVWIAATLQVGGGGTRSIYIIIIWGEENGTCGDLNEHGDRREGGWGLKKRTRKEKNNVCTTYVYVYIHVLCAVYLWLLLLWTNRQTNRLHIVFWREWIGKMVDGRNSARSSWDNLSRGSFASVKFVWTKSLILRRSIQKRRWWCKSFRVNLLYDCLSYGLYIIYIAYILRRSIRLLNLEFLRHRSY